MENKEEYPELDALIEWELRRLHIGANLVGHRYLLRMIKDTVRNPELVGYVMKGLYYPTAALTNTSPACVEHGVRTAISACWDRGGREALDEMAGTHLIERPYSSEFIDIVASYIRDRR